MFDCLQRDADKISNIIDKCTTFSQTGDSKKRKIAPGYMLRLRITLAAARTKVSNKKYPKRLFI